MVKVKDIFEQNQEEKKTIFIHLHKEKNDKHDPLLDVLWEGWLKDIPTSYMEYEVISKGQSLADNEKGINGFYIGIKEIAAEQLKIGEMVLRFNDAERFNRIKEHMEVCSESELNNEFVATRLIELGMNVYKFL